MRKFSPLLDPRVNLPDGSALVVEVVEAVMLSRVRRKRSDVPRVRTRLHERIEDLHLRTKRLARLATSPNFVDRLPFSPQRLRVSDLFKVRDFSCFYRPEMRDSNGYRL